jgi:hypothetical protein
MNITLGLIENFVIDRLYSYVRNNIYTKGYTAMQVCIAILLAALGRNIQGSKEMYNGDESTVLRLAREFEARASQRSFRMGYFGIFSWVNARLTIKREMELEVNFARISEIYENFVPEYDNWENNQTPRVERVTVSSNRFDATKYLEGLDPFEDHYYDYKHNQGSKKDKCKFPLIK